MLKSSHGDLDGVQLGDIPWASNSIVREKCIILDFVCTCATNTYIMCLCRRLSSYHDD